MDDAVGDEDVGDDNLGRVDENLAVDDADVELGAVEGGQGGVGQATAVADDTVDDVVLEDIGEGLGGQVGGHAADGGKGLVGRGKDGHIGQAGQGVAEAGGSNGANKRSQVGGTRGRDDALGHGEDLVDDVDDTSGEVDVL